MPIKNLPPEDVICIRSYSVDFCGMLVLQVITWMIIGSWDKDPYTHRGDSLVYRWYGFVFFFPTFIYGFWCFYKINMLQRRRTTEMSVDNYEREMKGTEPLIDDGFPRTEADHHLEYVQNTGLYMKYMWFWFAMWFPIVKMSFDDHNRYAWSFVLFPLLLFVSYFMMLAIQSGNYLGIDQRDINIMHAADSHQKQSARVKSIIQKVNYGPVDSDPQVGAFVKSDPPEDIFNDQNNNNNKR